MKAFKKFQNKEFLALLVILILAALLRFYKLESIPSGLYVDEAAIGYNAYSFLETGKDEYGKTFPFFLRSYGAYSSPLYTYLTTFPVAIFGLNVFSVRFLSVICGLLNVILFYLISKEFGLIKKKENILLGSFLFAITPWNIFFSRGAFEANVALTLFMTSVYFFLLARERINLLYGSAIFLALSTYAYQAQRLGVYIFLFGVSLLYFRDKLWKKEIILPVILFLVIQLPQLSLLTTPAFTLRASGLFYKDAVINQADKILFLPEPIAYGLSFIREFTSQAAGYLSPKNLFFLPDSDPQRSIPELSVFYSWMVVPFLVGVFFGLQKTREKLALWILMASVAIIPVSLTGDPFSSLRSLPLVLPIGLVIAKGMEIFAEKGKRFYWITTVLVVFTSLVTFWRCYFVLFSKERANAWDFGYESLAQIVKENPGSTFVLDQSRKNPSYVLMAFFLEYPPAELQKRVDSEIKRNYYQMTQFDPYYKFANIETRQIYWEEDVYKDLVLVGDELAVSEDQAEEHSLEKLFEIKDPLERKVFVGYKTRPDLKCSNTGYENPLCRKSN